MVKLISLLQIETESHKRVLVDGQNVLKHNGGKVNLENLESLRQWSKENGVQPLIVLPKTRYYLNLFSETSDIKFVNYRIHDDSAILQLAQHLKLPIISNDFYRDFRDLYPDFNFDKVFPFDIVCNAFITKATEFFRSESENVGNRTSVALA